MRGLIGEAGVAFDRKPSGREKPSSLLRMLPGCTSKGMQQVIRRQRSTPALIDSASVRDACALPAALRSRPPPALAVVQPFGSGVPAGMVIPGDVSSAGRKAESMPTHVRMYWREIARSRRFGAIASHCVRHAALISPVEDRPQIIHLLHPMSARPLNRRRFRRLPDRDGTRRPALEAHMLSPEGRRAEPSVPSVLHRLPPQTASVYVHRSINGEPLIRRVGGNIPHYVTEERWERQTTFVPIASKIPSNYDCNDISRLPAHSYACRRCLSRCGHGFEMGAQYRIARVAYDAPPRAGDDRPFVSM